MNEDDRPDRGVDDPVVLVTYPFLTDAYVLRSRLEFEGIPCFIPEEHHSSIVPGGTAMVVRILVNRDDLEAARKVMGDVEPSPDPKCPNCDGIDLEATPSPKNYFRTALGLLFGIPMKGEFKRLRCRACGNRWTGKV